MNADSFRCPNCGSSEFDQVGSDYIKCVYCHTMFQEKPLRPGSRHTKLVMLEGQVVKKCPYCNRIKPLEEFKDDICADCYEEFRETVRSSESERISAEIEGESKTENTGRWILFAIYGIVFVVALIGFFMSDC